MANKLDLLAELSLDLSNVLFDVVFALILGTQTESLHAPNRFHRQSTADICFRR
jgi:hypothetical protein